MFGALFGWRKASKCKKLIRRVQCRLKLLKNKRCSIVRQLREDVAQLLKYGRDQSAFDRVEQLFKDESIVAVYDLLDHFCEFIVIHLSYIRKHKDCPNDINEAVSTLIFASARCGDLPELPVIRRLFGERYGQRFALVALELLPGNLVNHQIKENLSIKSVPDDVKYKLVDEIARSCLQPGPLALEYYSELQQEQMNKANGDQVLTCDVQTNSDRNEDSQMQELDVMEAEGKIVHVDFSSDNRKISIESCNIQQGSDGTGGSRTPYSLEWSMHRKKEGVGNYTLQKEVGMDVESSSESSAQFPKEMVYLDDIEEFKSPINEDGNYGQDQRLFMFKSSVTFATAKLEDGFDESNAERNESWNEKAGSRSITRSRKAFGKRHRMRSVSRECTSVKDVESKIYYGGSFSKSRHRKKHRKKISFDENEKTFCAQARLGQPCHVNNRKDGIAHDCSLEDPCYFCTSDDKDDWGSQKRKIATLEGFPLHNLEEGKVGHIIICYHCRCLLTRERNKLKPIGDFQMGGMTKGDKLSYNEPIKEAGKGDGFGHPPYLRAMTLPPQRPTSDCRVDNMLRSNSHPFEQPSRLNHVHPKLPDYDQLAAEFMARKKANLQCKSNQLVALAAA